MSTFGEGRVELRTLLLGALGCNVAWGLIDAIFYLMSCLTERGHKIQLMRELKESQRISELKQILSGVLPEGLNEWLRPEDYRRLQAEIRNLNLSSPGGGLKREDIQGATGVFLLVFFSTFPVIVPFLIFEDAHLALRCSNVIAVGLLFAAGFKLGKYAGTRPIFMGLWMVLLGMGLVGLCIALGG